MLFVIVCRLEEKNGGGEAMEDCEAAMDARKDREKRRKRWKTAKPRGSDGRYRVVDADPFTMVHVTFLESTNLFMLMVYKIVYVGWRGSVDLSVSRARCNVI
jgi:hypothetical protein